MSFFPPGIFQSTFVSVGGSSRISCSPIHGMDAQNVTLFKISSILHPSPWDKRPWEPAWALG